MESHAELYRRYALCLALVPDESVAGDLFMRARTEAEAVRLAGLWREDQGLDPLLSPETLPGLTEHQQEHALHMARRARVRRQMRAGLGAAAASVAVVLGILWFAGSRARDLVTEPVFSGWPVVREPLPSGHTVQVLKAEGTPGAIRVWWELRGVGAGSAGERLEPSLALFGGAKQVAPAEHRGQRADSTRYVARTTYAVWLYSQDPVNLRFATSPEATVTVPVTWDEGAPAVRSNIPVGFTLGPAAYTLEETEFTAGGTRVRYRVSAPESLVVPNLALLAAERGTLGRGAAQRSEVDGSIEVQAPPLRIGAQRVFLHFPSPYRRLGSREYRIGGAPELGDWQRSGTTASVMLMLEDDRVPDIYSRSQPVAYLADENGRRYPLGVRGIESRPAGGEWGQQVQLGHKQVEGASEAGVAEMVLMLPDDLSYQHRFRLEARDLPADARPVSVYIPDVLQLYPMAVIQVTLPIP